MRDLLFDHAHIQGLFCFENRKAIFEGVDSRFKFIVLTFEKTSMPRLQQAGETNASAPPDDLLAPTRTGALGTTRFPAAFMRHNVDELERFPGDGAIWLDVELVKKLSPEAHAVMEFKDALEVEIAKRLLRFPLLGASLAETWNLKLCQEFNMTTDSDLFKTSPAPGRLPLWEGKQLHQFNADFGKPRYWLSENEASAALMASRLRMLVLPWGSAANPTPRRSS